VFFVRAGRQLLDGAGFGLGLDAARAASRKPGKDLVELLDQLLAEVDRAPYADRQRRTPSLSDLE
jgi:hypothetical protein